MFCGVLNAQYPVIVDGFYKAPAVVSVDSANWETQYKAVYYQMSASNRPNLDTSDKYNTFVRSLVDSGYWARADLLYVAATKREAEADMNWIDPDGGTYDLDETGAGNLTFTPYEGWTGDSVNYLVTNYTPSSSATNFAQNDGTIGVYIRTDLNGEYKIFSSEQDPSNYLRFYPRLGGTLYSKFNDDTNVTYSNASSQGMYILTRTGATAKAVYKAGASIATSSGASTGLPNVALKIFSSVGGDGNSRHQWSIFFVSDGVSATEADEINDICEILMDALGKGVQ